MSAASSAGSAISGALSSAYSAISSFIPSSIKSNAVGGIYPRGEFVTTFAEESAEAAIPLDKTKRSIGLWERVGQMLGVLPRESKPKTEEPKRTLPGISSRVPIGDRDVVRPSILAAPKLPSLPMGLKLPELIPLPEKKSETPSSRKTPPILHALESYVGESRSTTLRERLSEYERSEMGVGGSAMTELPSITINLTVNGAASREEVEGAVPTLRENIEEALKRYRHEQERRSYA